MPERALLFDVAIVLAASFPVLFLCRKLKLPQIVGFLLTGVAIGPHAFAAVSDSSRIEGIAELGVVLILFFVGLEFPLERLARLGRTALVGGPVQMGLTVSTATLLLRSTGEPWGVAVFAGLLVSLSSTAVVLPILKARDELAAPYARRFLGVALFQDLAVLPLVLLLPALAPGRDGGPSLLNVSGRVFLAFLFVVILVAAARTVVPRLLDGVVRLGSRESFTGGVVVLVLGLIALAEGVGVSAALGAFAAGIVLGESEHVHDVAATLAPFRDLLSSLFFVSIGMLLDPRFLAASPVLVAGAVGLVVVVKALTSYLALLVAGSTPLTAARAALTLATVGEFSFVLARAGLPLGLLSPDSEQLFVAVAVLTLALAPFVIAAAPRLVSILPERVEMEGDAAREAPPAGHILVVGYGLTGRSVCRALAETGVREAVLEADPDRVAAARRDGVRAFRADATAIEGLLAAGLEKALGVVVTIPDPDGARRVVRLCRLRNADVRILVRTRYVAEVESLRSVGANEVIPEEFETSIEIVARVFRLLHLPGNVVATQIRLLRDETYRRLRDTVGTTADGRRVSALVAAGTTELFLVLPDTHADGKTLDALHLTGDHVAVPALLRDGKPFAPPPADLRIEPGDTLLLVGAHEDLARVQVRLEGPRET